MNKRKKIYSVFSFLLAGTLCLSMAACGGTPTPAEDETTSSAPLSGALPVKALQPKHVDENPYMAKSDANIHHDGYNTDSTDEILPLGIYPRLDVFGFIKKPIDEEILTKTFLETYQRVCSKMVYFTFSYKHEEYKILCKEILYFESNARKVTIYTQNGEHYTFNGKLSEIEQKMSDGKIPFLRVHQSYLVNYYLIRSRTKIEITLVNGKKLSISEERQKYFNQQYSHLLGGEINV